MIDPGALLPGVRRRPFLTWTLLCVNILLWLLVEISGEKPFGGSTNTEVLLKFGAMEAWHIATGEYWRMFTSTFLHSGLLHLAFNCIGLFIFGHQLEQIYGHARFIAIYLIAALAGSVASYALSIGPAPNTIGVGASGAVFGLLGSLVVFYAAQRSRLGQAGQQTLIGLVVIATVNVVLGFVIPGVDNFAHIGGFIAGLLTGLAYTPIYRSQYGTYGSSQRVADVNSMLRRWWVIPMAAALVLAGIYLANLNLLNTPTPYLVRAEQHRLDGEVALALEALDRAIEIDPNHSVSYFRRGQLMAEQGNSSLASSDLGRAIRLGLPEADKEDAIRLMAELSER